MEEIVDARGLGCPQPVILAKRALERHARVVVYVDNATAYENVRRLGAKLGCEVTIDRQPDGSHHLHLSRGETAVAAGDESATRSQVQKTDGAYVVAITGETMGRGNDELGALLMKAFIHTLLQLEALPDRIIFYNAGVKLAARGSDVADDLRQLAEAGVELLLCGTCVNFYGLSGQTLVGSITNMFEIAGSLAAADRLVTL